MSTTPQWSHRTKVAANGISEYSGRQTRTTQLQTNTYVAPPVPASSTFSAASVALSAAANGSLDPTNTGVSPATLQEVVADASAAPTRPAKKGKGVGKRLTDRERVEILELIEKSGGALTNSEVARRYGITRAAIQKLKAKGPEVRARYRYGSAETRDDRKRGGHSVSVPFERELYEWVRGLKARKVPVPPSLVKEKAKLLVPKYGLGNFQASNGWYYNFCRRFNLIAAALAGEKEVETAKGPALAETMATAEEDTSLEVDHSPQLQQMTENPQPTLSVYEQQLQQYQHQMAAIAAVTLQQQQEQVEEELQQQVQEKQQQLQREADATQGNQSKSDRMLMLLERQNALLERQNGMIEDQAKTIKKLYAVVTKDAGL
ncbi:hypothetical protein PRIC2_012508 [Phytophthora ramorum]